MTSESGEASGQSFGTHRHRVLDDPATVTWGFGLGRTRTGRLNECARARAARQTNRRIVSRAGERSASPRALSDRSGIIVHESGRRLARIARDMWKGRFSMHPRVRAFVEDLHQYPPTDLRRWLDEGPQARAAHLREFDLEDLSDPGHARRVEVAEKVLPYLIDFAKHGRTMTFTEFVEFAGAGNKRLVNGGILNPLTALCLTRGLPPLWTLVVAAATGLGSGYWRERDDSHKVARQEECFAHYGAVRQPETPVGDVCPDCFTQRTPTGACFC